LALNGLKFYMCLVYIDDIIVYSATVGEHIERLKKLLDRLRSANLKLKPSKCSLLRAQVSFLGHVVSGEGVATDPEKIRAVEEWPAPTDLHEVRSFLGLVSYYRRFVPTFASIAAPLHALSAKIQKFIWSSESKESFRQLKTALISSPVLAMPNDGDPFLLDTDTCDVSIRAILSQMQDGVEQVISYASRSLSKPERNNCVTRKELLAVVCYARAFRQYLLGRQFVIRTDHSALQWLHTTPEPIGQQACWCEIFQEFDFQIIHRPGRNHGNADALSRRPCRQCGKDQDNVKAENVRAIDFVALDPNSRCRKAEIARATETDPELSQFVKWMLNRVLPIDSDE